MSNAADLEARIRNLEMEIKKLKQHTGGVPAIFGGAGSKSMNIYMVSTFTGLPSVNQVDPPAIAYVQENGVYYGLIYLVPRWVAGGTKPSPTTTKIWFPMMPVRSSMTTGTNAAKHPYNSLMIHSAGEQTATWIKDHDTSGHCLTSFVEYPVPD